MMNATLSSVAQALLAGPRSRSSTSIGSSAAMAGPKKVEKQAARIESATMAIVGASSITAAASASMRTPRATSVTSSTIRRSNRSATMPAGTESSTYGQDARGADDAEQHRRVAVGVDDHQDRDEVEPVADAGDELAGEQPRQRGVAAEEVEVGPGQAHRAAPSAGGGARDCRRRWRGWP